jgi:hypothetical protein
MFESLCAKKALSFLVMCSMMSLSACSSSTSISPAKDAGTSTGGPDGSMSTDAGSFDSTSNSTGDGPSSDSSGVLADGSDGADSAASAGNIIRSVAYHQITSLMAGPTSAAVMSRNGKTIAFAVAPGSENPASPNTIFVVNADGTGLKQVDSYVTRCFCGSILAISDDGQTIVSTDSTQVRVVGADGTLKGKVEIDSNEIAELAISGDGKKVFFVSGRDPNLLGTTTPVPRGVSSFNADGSGLALVAGADAVAMLTGVMATDVFTFGVCAQSLGVSFDGSHIVFATRLNKMGDVLLGSAGDGSGLHIIAGPIPNSSPGIGVISAGLSGNGTKAFYRVEKNDASRQVRVADFAGGNDKLIADKPPMSYCASLIQITGDGSQILLGESGRMYPTAGGDPISLLQRTGFYSTDPLFVGDNAVADPHMTLADDGKHFAYLSPDKANIKQIATAELNPAASASAPSVSSVTMTPPSIALGGASTTVAATVTGGATLLRVGTAVFLAGVEDTNDSYGAIVLLDDGKPPDAVAGDHVFTGAGIHVGTVGTSGARLVRVKAEATAADGTRHATAADATGLGVQ